MNMRPKKPELTGPQAKEVARSIDSAWVQERLDRIMHELAAKGEKAQFASTALDAGFTIGDVGKFIQEYDRRTGEVAQILLSPAQFEATLEDARERMLTGERVPYADILLAQEALDVGATETSHVKAVLEVPKIVSAVREPFKSAFEESDQDLRKDMFRKAFQALVKEAYGKSSYHFSQNSVHDFLTDKANNKKPGRNCQVPPRLMAAVLEELGFYDEQLVLVANRQHVWLMVQAGSSWYKLDGSVQEMQTEDQLYQELAGTGVLSADDMKAGMLGLATLGSALDRYAKADMQEATYHPVVMEMLQRLQTFDEWVREHLPDKMSRSSEPSFGNVRRNSEGLLDLTRSALHTLLVRREVVAPALAFALLGGASALDNKKGGTDGEEYSESSDRGHGEKTASTNAAKELVYAVAKDVADSIEAMHDAYGELMAGLKEKAGFSEGSGSMKDGNARAYDQPSNQTPIELYPQVSQEEVQKAIERARGVYGTFHFVFGAEDAVVADGGKVDTAEDILAYTRYWDRAQAGEVNMALPLPKEHGEYTEIADSVIDAIINDFLEGIIKENRTPQENNKGVFSVFVGAGATQPTIYTIEIPASIQVPENFAGRVKKRAMERRIALLDADSSLKSRDLMNNFEETKLFMYQNGEEIARVEGMARLDMESAQLMLESRNRIYDLRPFMWIDDNEALVKLNEATNFFGYTGDGNTDDISSHIILSPHHTISEGVFSAELPARLNYDSEGAFSIPEGTPIQELSVTGVTNKLDLSRMDFLDGAEVTLVAGSSQVDLSHIQNQLPSGKNLHLKVKGDQETTCYPESAVFDGYDTVEINNCELPMGLRVMNTRLFVIDSEKRAIADHPYLLATLANVISEDDVASVSYAYFRFGEVSGSLFRDVYNPIIDYGNMHVRIHANVFHENAISGAKIAGVALSTTGGDGTLSIEKGAIQDMHIGTLVVNMNTLGEVKIDSGAIVNSTIERVVIVNPVISPEDNEFIQELVGQIQSSTTGRVAVYQVKYDNMFSMHQENFRALSEYSDEELNALSNRH